MKTLVLFAAIVAAVSSSSCVDGVNNVIKLADVTDESVSVHLKNIVLQTYDASNNPQCFNSQAEMFFPGSIKLVSGDVIVREKTDLAANGLAKLTMAKNSFLVGTVCRDGVAVSSFVPKNDCQFSFCQLLGTGLCNIFTTPGTHTLGQIEQSENMTSIIQLPKIPSIINNVLRGQWKVEMKLVSGDKVVADMKFPSNSEWLNIDR
uniref:Diagnostic antigen gp50 n=1 Tax=Steinernema glaseri TaxID=37863 RepID=A0A1I7YG80_9BILA